MAAARGVAARSDGGGAAALEDLALDFLAGGEGESSEEESSSEESEESSPEEEPEPEPDPEEEEPDPEDLAVTWTFMPW